MNNDVLNEAMKYKLLLSPDAKEALDSAGLDYPNLQELLSITARTKSILTKQDVLDFLSGDKAVSKAEKVIAVKPKKNCEVNVIVGSDITGNSTCTGTIQDFATYIQARFKTLSNILLRNPECKYATKIANVKGLYREVCILGMIYNVNRTKNGHLIIELEDMSGSIKVFISKDSPLINETFVNDEVIGVFGKQSESGLFIARNVYFPDLPAKRKWEPSDSTSSVAFISDIHVGSKEFLQTGWEAMIHWLKRNHDRQEINYLVLAGDVVDGIGVYPDQEYDLMEQDIYKQYGLLADLLKEVPDDMQIVLQPGNHDACRLAEPQPALSKIYTGGFDSHVILTGNPVNLEIENRVITSYHGKSFDDWIGAIKGAKYENPLPIMQTMLQKRHLAPIYGARNALAPEKTDYLALNIPPDILITGHIHNFAVGEYRGTKMINSSTYQSQTSYQAEHNFNPVPCRLPVCHLGTGKITIKDFSR